MEFAGDHSGYHLAVPADLVHTREDASTPNTESMDSGGHRQSSLSGRGNKTTRILGAEFEREKTTLATDAQTSPTTDQQVSGGLGALSTKV